MTTESYPTFVVVFSLTELLFICLVSLKLKRPVNLFSITTVILYLSYIYPNFYQFGMISDQPNPGLVVEDWVEAAFFKTLLFKTAWNFAYFYILMFNDVQANKNKSYIVDAPLVPNFYVSAFGLISLILLLAGVGDPRSILFASSRFFGNELFLNIYKVFSLIALFLALLNHYTYKKNYILVILFLILSQLYSMAIFSRFVVVPFGLYFVMRLIFDSSTVKQVLNLLLIFLFYSNSIFGRSGELGVVPYLSSWYELMVALPLIFQYVVSTVSGQATLTLVLSGLSDGIITAKPNPLLFVLYASPMPSSFIGSGIYAYQSLTPYFNFPIGINTDLIGESILWFGNMHWVFGACLGLLYAKIDVNLYKTRLYQFLFFACLIFIGLSTVASIRAASRIFMYIVFVYMSLIFLGVLTRVCKEKYNEVIR